MGYSMEKTLDSTKILEQKCEQINNKIQKKNVYIMKTVMKNYLWICYNCI